MKQLRTYALATGLLMVVGYLAVVIAFKQEDGPRERFSLLEDSSPTPQLMLEGGGFAGPVLLNPLEQLLLEAHNIERAQAGLRSFETDAMLVDLARERASDMAVSDYFSHEAANGDTVATLLKREGYAYKVVSENIARNNRPDEQSVDAAMASFLNSADRRDEVLSDRYERVGVGIADSRDGLKYYVVVFTGY